MATNTFLALIFASVSHTQGLPDGLLSAICWVESSHRVAAVHKDDGTEDSIGVCQVQYTTAKHLGYAGTADALKDPSTNALYAAKYLKKQIKRYNGKISYGVAAYNMGHLKLGKKGNPVNQKYVDKVFMAWGKRK